MKILQRLMPLLIVAFLSACSSTPSGPTEADARAAVEQDIRDHSQGCIKLVDLRKTGETELANVMLVNASVKIEFLEDCSWPITNTVLVLKTVPGGTPNVKKGEQRTLDLTWQFHKTEAGWKTNQKRDPTSGITQ